MSLSLSLRLRGLRKWTMKALQDVHWTSLVYTSQQVVNVCGRPNMFPIHVHVGADWWGLQKMETEESQIHKEKIYKSL